MREYLFGTLLYLIILTMDGSVIKHPEFKAVDECTSKILNVLDKKYLGYDSFSKIYDFCYEKENYGKQ